MINISLRKVNYLFVWMIIISTLFLLGCTSSDKPKYIIYPGDFIMGNKIEPCFVWGQIIVRNLDKKTLDVFTIDFEIQYKEGNEYTTIYKKSFIGENLEPDKEYVEKYKVDIQCKTKPENYRIIAKLKDEDSNIIAECEDACKKPFLKR